ncbi:hypothetical protein ATO6_08615 [Oceanicola sp. 22II-s10i]|uniref:hypothetical protein n=1 Tax=Oceanicola sp. 22II-s10i TaxID=1317116 RepID=UPI000B52205E|nr:hypothetical protein [Oceanicola sp. 22II-s10i]OWU85099.1 hypothetical protein ATO6_08615 [Oceanicola sp. 22II-s10i]
MKFAVLAGLTGLALSAAPAMAQDVMPAYPYAGANYCPAGLQPIVIGGVICCGVPNQTVSYEYMKQHPVQTRRSYARPHWDGSKSPEGYWDGSKSTRG